MSIIANAKEIAELVKKLDDVELYRKIIELEGEIIELTREKHALELRVEELNKSLQTTSQMSFREPFYYVEGDSVPFCPKCWEVDKISVHLFYEEHFKGETKYVCHHCHSIFWHNSNHKRPRNDN